MSLKKNCLGIREIKDRLLSYLPPSQVVTAPATSAIILEGIILVTTLNVTSLTTVIVTKMQKDLHKRNHIMSHYSQVNLSPVPLANNKRGIQVEHLRLKLMNAEAPQDAKFCSFVK